MEYRETARWIAGARRVVALTGAGMSAESGIPTFRGAGGLWKNFRAEELATPEAFSQNPRRVWEWYNERRMGIAQKKPNIGHDILAEWERKLPDLGIITQNVDGLHERAGSTRVVRIHGSIWETLCQKENRVEINRETPLAETPPVCRTCGSILRPNVVWFGEVIPPQALRSCDALLETCDLLLVIGTSGLVFPAADIPHEIKRRGGNVVEINPEETPLTAEADISLRGKAGEILAKIDAIRSTDI